MSVLDGTDAGGRLEVRRRRGRLVPVGAVSDVHGVAAAALQEPAAEVKSWELMGSTA